VIRLRDCATVSSYEPREQFLGSPRVPEDTTQTPANILSRSS